MPARQYQSVLIWLWVNVFMIVAMVLIGGVTRLTGSGLSIVEWAPLMGAIPPLNQQDWLALFEQYKQFPQYQQVNHWMTLADFKQIFFWEYVHRLWGRLIGVVYLVPMLFFWWQGALENTPKVRILAAFFLGGLQGVVGWYMVMSGLVDQPAVSHLRLAIHFGLAVFVMQWIVWIILDMRQESRLEQAGNRLRWLVWVTLIATSVQLVYGAFMAGSRAGYLFRGFPLMNGYVIPPQIWQHGSLLENLIHNPVGIHAVHRWFAYAVAGLVVWLGVLLARARPVLGWGLIAIVLVQFLLGALTVLTNVQLGVAVLHQLGGVTLMTGVVWAFYIVVPVAKR